MSFVSHFHNESSVQRIKPFVLLEVYMARRTEPAQLTLLNDQRTALRLSTAYLDMQKASITQLQDLIGQRMPRPHHNCTSRFI